MFFCVWTPEKNSFCRCEFVSALIIRMSGKRKQPASSTIAKRPRSVNFTPEDLENFLGIALQHSALLESKATDEANNKLKNEAWDSITADYNAQSTIQVILINFYYFVLYYCNAFSLCFSAPSARCGRNTITSKNLFVNSMLVSGKVIFKRAADQWTESRK